MEKEKLVKTIVESIIGFGLFLTMVLTCPDRPKHVKAMSNQYANCIQTEMGGGIFGGLVYKASGKISGFLIDNGLEYRDFWIISIGILRDGSDTLMFSIGAFGHVGAFMKNSS